MGHIKGRHLGLNPDPTTPGCRLHTDMVKGQNRGEIRVIIVAVAAVIQKNDDSLKKVNPLNLTWSYKKKNEFCIINVKNCKRNYCLQQNFTSIYSITSMRVLSKRLLNR